MDKTTLIRDRTVRADEDVVRDRLAEDLDFENIGDDLLCLAIDVGMHQRNVVIASDHVPERGKSFLDALKGNRVWEGVSQVLQFLVRRCRWYEEPVAVAGGETSDDAGTADGGV